MKRLLLTIGTLLTVVLPAVPAHAQDNVTPGCLDQVYGRIAHEEREYRSVLFGQKLSKDLPTGSVRFDTEYDVWMKTGNNQWKSPDNEGLTWSDTLMDQQSDVKRRRGIFETKKKPTSDLIPPLLQSVRALQCRLRAVCDAARASATAKTPTVKVQPDGCLEFELPVFTACTSAGLTETSAGSCSNVVEGLMEREIKLLETVVVYDAAYRSLMQFAGTFEGFLRDFRFPLLQPIWQAVRALGSLDDLPCFLAQCDM